MLPKKFIIALSACLLMLQAWAHQNNPKTTLAPLLQKVMPSVVNLMIAGVEPADPSPHHPSAPPSHHPFQKVGSGVVIDAQGGYIVTNAHVVSGARHIVVTLHDGRHLLAHIKGQDPLTDLAVLQVKAKGLKSIPHISQHKLQVGDFVTAIGNPFGLQQTVTSGIVSGLHRHVGIEGIENFIQTDAPINPGNSGGALLNMKGELVGINTAIIGAHGGNIGIGFAIPINMANPVIAQLIKHGNVKRGRLGIVAQDLTPALADAMSLKGIDGAIINRIFPSSAAQKAGLKRGDIITAINNIPVNSAGEVRSYLGVVRTQSPVSLTIQRGQQKRLIKAVLGSDKPLVRTIHSPLAGLGLRDYDAITPLSERISGVEVTTVAAGSKAWLSGIRKGDIILAANGQRLKSMNALIHLIQTKKPAQLLMMVERGQNRLFLVVAA